MTLGALRFALVAGLVFQVVGCSVNGQSKAEKSPWMIELGRLRQIGLEIQFYAGEHHGEFPSSWAQLVRYAGASWEKDYGQFRDPATGSSLAWLYQGGKGSRPMGRYIIAAAPKVAPPRPPTRRRATRPVLWSDTSAELLDESVFQRLCVEHELFLDAPGINRP